MAFTKQYVLDELTSTNYIYWQVLAGGKKGDKIASYEPGANSKDDPGDPDESYNKLKRVLDAAQYGMVTVILRQKYGGDNNVSYKQYVIPVQLENGVKDTAPGIAGAGVTTINVPEQNNSKITALENQINQLKDLLIKQQHSSEFEKLENLIKEQELRHKQEMDQLRRENEELNKELDEYFDEEENEEEEKRIAAIDENDPNVKMGKLLAGYAEKFGDKLIEPLANGLADKVTGVFKKEAAPVHGTDEKADIQNHTQTIDEVDAQKKKCAQAGIILLGLDGKAGDHLLELAEFAKLNFEGYKMGVTYVKGQLVELREKKGTI
jgi:hypothetical protein